MTKQDRKEKLYGKKCLDFSKGEVIFVIIKNSGFR